MKGLWKFLVGLALGASVGWGMGYIRFPLLENDAAFWVGCASGAAFVLVALAAWMFSRRPAVQAFVSGKRSASIPKYRSLGISVLILVFVGSLLLSFVLNGQRKVLAGKIERLEQRDTEWHAALGELQSERQAGLVGNVLNKVDAELAADPEGKLSAATIQRIAAVSLSLKPYRTFAKDTLAAQELSPERGQLLMALAAMGLDSASFAEIWRTATFAGADLAHADLRGANLAGVDLKGANLKDVNLSGADLHGADLLKANLWGAQMESANLSGAHLKRANLAWAELNGAELQLAILNGADLSNAKLRQADLAGAQLQWAEATGAMFNEANLMQVDLLGTGLAKVNLTNANLLEANLMAVDLSDARLQGAALLHAACGSDLLDKLTEWRVDIATQLQTQFEIVDDTVRRYVSAIFRLEKVAP